MHGYTYIYNSRCRKLSCTAIRHENTVLILVSVYYMHGNDFQGQMNTKNVKFSTFSFVGSTPKSCR